jgi:hypothetical protein
MQKLKSIVALVVFLFSVSTIVVFVVGSCNQSRDHKRAVSYASCVTEVLESASKVKVSPFDRDRRVLEVCERFGPDVPLEVDATGDQFLVLRSAGGGVFVFWKLSETHFVEGVSRPGMRGYRWIFKDLSFSR